MKETEDTQRTLSDFCLEVDVGKMGLKLELRKTDEEVDNIISEPR